MMALTTTADATHTADDFARVYAVCIQTNSHNIRVRGNHVCYVRYVWSCVADPSEKGSEHIPLWMKGLRRTWTR